jgi:hypothetical protein
MLQPFFAPSQSLGTSDTPTFSSLVLSNQGSAAVTPLLNFLAANGGWQVGVDTANSPGGRDFFIAKGTGSNPNYLSSVSDFLYFSHNGANTPTLGIGYTPGNSAYTVSISAPDAQPANGCMLIRVGASQTGKAFLITDSTPTDKWWVDKDFYQSPTNIRDLSSPTSLLTFSQNGLGAVYEWKYSGNAMQFRYASGNTTILQFQTSGKAQTVNDLDVGLSGATTGNLAVTGSAALGNAGISSSTFLNMPAGTTAKSQMRLIAGATPASPVDGDIWYDGTNIKMRQSSTTKTFTLT